MKLLLVTLLLSSWAIADEYLISEMESLKSTLEKNDPDRTELSLRLADLYFDVSIQEGEGKNIIINRNKSAKLYKKVLSGEDGLIKPVGQNAIKIKFQLARVLGKLNSIKESKKYYLSVFNDDLSSKKFKRESALALAEYYEEDVNFKKADEFYNHGITLCESIETCNYAHYKRAWLLYKEVRLDEAIVELKKSLWDSKKQARDKVINDLLLFFSASVTEGHNELAFIRDLAKKTNQPNLVRKLVESFYAAGNRIAGSNVLVEWNEKNPSLFYELRLLEEFYGFRNWDRVRNYLSRVEKRNHVDLPKEKEEAKEIQAMLKRVIVQLDSEVDQDETYAKELLRSIDIYLGFYPNDDMRKKLQQGWIKVQKDELEKINRLKIWISEDIRFNTDQKYIRKLRQSRLALAQKHNLSDTVLEESLAISNMLETPENREFKYVYAHELYKLKNYKKSLPLFLELANNAESVDDWAIKSQNLSLDIYNSQKNYAALVDQSKKWTQNADLVSNKKLAQEIKQMSLVQTQASFEHTASLGKTNEALEKFYKFCMDKVFEQKSCQNAKVLAIELKDQGKLVSLLEKSKDEKALIVEYELMGKFSKAAKLHEKFNLNKSAQIETYFKIALLYEMDQNFKQRDKILNKLISKIKRDKKIPLQWEDALYVTLSEANLLNEKTLILPWAAKNKLAIATKLTQQKGHKKSHKILISGEKYTGPFWAKNVLKQAEVLFKKQAKISFYGRRSQTLFKRRTRAVEKLNTFAKKYLEGANSETRVYLLDTLKRAYGNFAFEILNTPLPEGLAEDMILQVTAQLNEMALPFNNVSKDYNRLLGEELKSLDKELNEKLVSQLNADEPIYSAHIEIPAQKEEQFSKDLDYSQLASVKNELEQNPNSIETLLKFESFYKENNSLRMAMYFTGRVNTLRGQND